MLYSTIKGKFGGKWDMIALDKFDLLSSYLQKRIDRTILGRNMKAKNKKRYSTFEEFINK